MYVHWLIVLGQFIFHKIHTNFDIYFVITIYYNLLQSESFGDEIR
jgi:hypothetical protein